HPPLKPEAHSPPAPQAQTGTLFPRRSTGRSAIILKLNNLRVLRISIRALKRTTSHLVLGNVIVDGSDLSHGRNLTTFNNVSLRLRTRHCLKHKARNRQRIRGIKDASLFALGLSSRSNFHI